MYGYSKKICFRYSGGKIPGCDILICVQPGEFVNIIAQYPQQSPNQYHVAC